MKLKLIGYTLGALALAAIALCILAIVFVHPIKTRPLGQIVAGHMEATFEIPSSHGDFVFLLVADNNQKPLVDGVIKLYAKDKEITSIRFKANDGEQERLLMPREETTEPGWRLVPIADATGVIDTVGRIHVGDFRRQRVRLNIALSQPNSIPMTVVLRWAE